MALRENSIYELLSVSVVTDHIGILVIWLLLLTTWASDTFAYFAGVKWGKRKIVPTISPSKSLDGIPYIFFTANRTFFEYRYNCHLYHSLSIKLFISC